MSDDLIEDAIDCLRGEGWDNEADAVDRSVAEIKRLRTDNENNTNPVLCQKIESDHHFIAKLRKQIDDAEIVNNHRYAELQHVCDDQDKQLTSQNAEIKHLREYINVIERVNTLHESNATKRREQLAAKDLELARWQKIAIDLKAVSYFVNFQAREQVFGLQPKEIQDKYRDRAAKELQLQATQEAGYVERLEEAVMKLYEMQLPMMDPETRKRHAQAALAKIREGKP